MAHIETNDLTKEGSLTDVAVKKIGSKVPSLHLENVSQLSTINRRSDSTDLPATNNKHYLMTDRSSLKSVSEKNQLQKAQAEAEGSPNRKENIQEEDKFLPQRRGFHNTVAHVKKASLILKSKDKGSHRTPVLDALELESRREEQIKRIKAQNKDGNLKFHLPQLTATQRKIGRSSPSHGHLLSKNQSPRYIEVTQALTSRADFVTKDQDDTQENVPAGRINYMFFPVSFKKALQLEGGPPQNPPFKVGLATTSNFTKNNAKEKEAQRKEPNQRPNPLAEKSPILQSPTETNSANQTPKNHAALKNSFSLTNKLKNIAIKRSNFLGISNLQIKFDRNRAGVSKDFEPQYRPKDNLTGEDAQLIMSPEAYRTFLKMRLSKLQEDDERILTHMPQPERFSTKTDNYSSGDLMRPQKISNESLTQEFLQKYSELRSSYGMYGKLLGSKSNTLTGTQETFQPIRASSHLTPGIENRSPKIKMSTHVLEIGFPESSPTAKFKITPVLKKLSHRSAMDSSMKANGN